MTRTDTLSYETIRRVPLEIVQLGRGRARGGMVQ